MRKITGMFSRHKEKQAGPTAREIFSSAASKNGALSMGMIAIVICIVVVINLIMGQLPDRIRNIDLTDNKLYEISDTTAEILDSLDKKIEMKVLAVKDSTDDRIQTFLDKYASMSKKIDLEWIDPVQHPSALEKYGTDGNSIVVNCPDTEKSTTIPFNDILVVDEMSYYTTGSTDPTSFDAEGQITGAVNYVTSDVSKIIYQTTGHGEGSLGTSMTDLLTKSNMEVKDLNLMMENSIPDDCDMLLMYAPTKDLTAEETKVIKQYLRKGGNVYLVMGAAEDSLPNLEGIMKVYGLEMEEGYIADPDRCYQGNYYYIFPELNVTEDMAENIESQMVLLVDARGMNQVDPARDSIAVNTFMSTSSTAHAVTEQGDEEGRYLLGAVATEPVDSDKKKDGEGEETGEKSDSEGKSARLTVVTAPSMIDEQITSTFTTLENNTLFTNSLSANFDDIQNVSIEPKSLETTYNTMQHTGLISLAAIFGIPLVVLGWGFMVWWKRRKS